MKFAFIHINTTIINKQKKQKIKIQKNSTKKHTSSTTIEILLHTKCFSGFRQYLI
jgi:hypothetical protein